MIDSLLWIEKYRPVNFDGIKGQDEIVKRVEAFVKKNNIPHMIFAGPAGTGKTTLALIAAKQIYKDEWHQNFLELNSSDERGIDTVRGKIKDFAKTKAISDVPYKIILLDECDSLTKDAQHALRRTMENYANSCRFILSANFSSKIIEPIQSRCAIFRFRPVDKEELKKIVEDVAKKEKLSVDKDATEILVNIAEGDVRRLLNIMQSCASANRSIDEESIYKIISAAKPKEIKEVLELAIKGNFIQARDNLLDTMLNYGLNGLDIIKQIQKEIWSLDIDNNKKLKLIDKCGEIEFRLVEGSDEFVQIEALLANFSG